MAVKRSRSAARVLAVLEEIARLQPVGLSELARHMDADKSAVQRALMTLADDGWIQQTGARPLRWEMTARIDVVAQAARSSNSLRERARPALEAIRAQCGETALLNVPDAHGFIVIDVLECQHELRASPPIGTRVPARNSATSRALLPYMDMDRQIAILGEAPDAALARLFASTLRNGYAVSVGEVSGGSTNIAAPVFESDGNVVGALVITGPSARLKAELHHSIGTFVRDTALGVPRGRPFSGDNARHMRAGGVDKRRAA